VADNFKIFQKEVSQVLNIDPKQNDLFEGFLSLSFFECGLKHVDNFLNIQPAKFVNHLLSYHRYIYPNEKDVNQVKEWVSSLSDKATLQYKKADKPETKVKLNKSKNIRAELYTKVLQNLNDPLPEEPGALVLVSFRYDADKHFKNIMFVKFTDAVPEKVRNDIKNIITKGTEVTFKGITGRDKHFSQLESKKYGFRIAAVQPSQVQNIADTIKASIDPKRDVFDNGISEAMVRVLNQAGKRTAWQAIKDRTIFDNNKAAINQHYKDGKPGRKKPYSDGRPSRQSLVKELKNYLEEAAKNGIQGRLF
jgi:hypothetical protein